MQEKKRTERVRKKRSLGAFLSNGGVKYAQEKEHGAKYKAVDARHSLIFYRFKNITFVSQLISYCCFVFYDICGSNCYVLELQNQYAMIYGISRLFCHYWIELECYSGTNRARNLQRIALES